MQCPFCKIDNDRVVDSRVIGNGREIRRRRKCLRCEKRFTTYERIEAVPRLVLKKNGKREIFSRSKVLAGLKKACMKRNISEEQLEEIIERVELELFEVCEGDIQTRAIGEKVSRCLLELDHVAYVRFASVYCEYKNAKDFLSVVEDLVPQGDSNELDVTRENVKGNGHRPVQVTENRSPRSGNGQRGDRIAVSAEK